MADVEARCTAIADQVVPAYRHGKRSYSCGSTVARAWRAAWDGACLGLGGDPADYRSKPPILPESTKS